jgi:hypothetical protein
MWNRITEKKIYKMVEIYQDRGLIPPPLSHNTGFFLRSKTSLGVGVYGTNFTFTAAAQRVYGLTP